MIRLIALVLLVAFATVLGFANLHVVQFHTVFGDEVQASLVLLLAASFVVGAGIAFVLGLFRSFGRRRRHHAAFTRHEDENLVPPTLPPAPKLPQTRARDVTATRQWR